MSQSDYLIRKRKNIITSSQDCIPYELSQPYNQSESLIETYNNKNENKILEKLYNSFQEINQSEYLERKKQCIIKTNLPKVLCSQQYSKNKENITKQCNENKSINYNSKSYDETKKYNYTYHDLTNVMQNEKQLCSGDYTRMESDYDSVISQSDYLVYKNICRFESVKKYYNISKKIRSLYENIAFELNELLLEYLNGNIEYVREQLTIEKYQYYSELLLYEKCEKLPDYENIRKIIVNILPIIQNSLVIEADLRNEIIELQKKITNITVPQENAVFSVSQEIHTVAKVKPEYLLYIEKYGLPENLVFDPDKLAEIVSNM